MTPVLLARLPHPRDSSSSHPGGWGGALRSQLSCRSLRGQTDQEGLSTRDLQEEGDNLYQKSLYLTRV